ncbi:uncharacterized protein [Argopecten irradians]|uniref:uncharacterized protein n=1 Tax=Argopecten irradians TaxID=31199 RepID=UPI003712A03C
MKTRRCKTSSIKGTDTPDQFEDGMETHKNLQLDKGDLVLCRWELGVWWPGYVVDIQHSTTSYVVGFWDEIDCVTRQSGDVCPFDNELPVIALSLSKICSFGNFVRQILMSYCFIIHLLRN